ncbi:MAG TPA: aminoglycoside phosphotransferase family protein, partial [Chloroflexota bacterium]
MTQPSASIPESFIRHTIEAFGSTGEAWLYALPALLVNLAGRWRLTLGSPFTLSFNYVIAARQSDGTEAVLKVGVERDAAQQEIDALRLYAGDGICRLLAADEANNAMLLERVCPGETLVELARTDDEAATRIAAGVMRQLWRPVPAVHQFLPVAVWFARAFARHRAEYGAADPFPAGIVQRAEALSQELLASSPRQVLLHGDLHHYNILTAERSPWLAIDPKGVIGDPGYDVGQFLLNPDLGGAERQPDVVRRRLDVFAEELAYDRA